MNRFRTIPKILSTITGIPIWPVIFGGVLSKWYFLSGGGGKSIKTLVITSISLSSGNVLLLKRMIQQALKYYSFENFSNYQQNFLKLNNTPYLAITLVQYSLFGFDEIRVSFSDGGSLSGFVFKRLWMLNVTKPLNITKMVNFPLYKQTRDPNILDVIQLYIYSQILKDTEWTRDLRLVRSIDRMFGTIIESFKQDNDIIKRQTDPVPSQIM